MIRHMMYSQSDALLRGSRREPGNKIMLSSPHYSCINIISRYLLPGWPCFKVCSVNGY